MGKSRLTAEERRSQIIEKAAEVFCVRGVHGTRTREVAEACDINEALLYRHFPSKEELWREVVATSYDDFTKVLQDLADKQPNGLMGVVTLTRAQLDILRKDPVLCGNIWHGVASAAHDPAMRGLVKDRVDSYYAYLKGLLVAGQQDGSVKDGLDPDRTTWFIRGLTWCFILRTLLKLDASESSDSPDFFCEGLVDLIAADPGSIDSSIT